MSMIVNALVPFGSRPQLIENKYVEEFVKIGLPKYSARVRYGLDLVLLHLTNDIICFNPEYFEKEIPHETLPSREILLGRINNIIL
jgi:hypothetical protein